MRLALLANPESWYARDLTRAASADHEVVTLPFSTISAAVLPPEEQVHSTPLPPTRNPQSPIPNPQPLSRFDALLVRTMPPGSLEQVVFRMDCLARLAAAGVVVLNSPKAIEAAVDKYLTTAKIAAAGLLTPRTICCQTADDAMLAFAQLGGDIVLKPLFGSEGRGITRLNDEALALRAFKMLAQLGAVLYLQEFVPHDGYDLRLLLIGDRVLGMRRRNQLDWRTNLSRGAKAEPFEPDRDLVEMARRAAAAVGAPLAGVDILPGKDGQLYTIEVNAVPGWKGLAQAHNLDIARLVIDYIASQVRHQGATP